MGVWGLAIAFSSYHQISTDNKITSKIVGVMWNFTQASYFRTLKLCQRDGAFGVEIKWFIS